MLISYVYDWKYNKCFKKYPGGDEIFRPFGPESHPAFCKVDSGSFPGVEAAWVGADPPPPSKCRSS